MLLWIVQTIVWGLATLALAGQTGVIRKPPDARGACALDSSRGPAHAELVIADGGLSLRQGRLLEDKVEVRDVDRTALILGVLAEHARSSEGRLHVALTQIAYQLPAYDARTRAVPGRATTASGPLG